MLRTTVLAAVLLIASQTATAQPTSTLHIKIVLSDVGGVTTPVARHALLISDNPSTTAPRLVTTGVDGSADVKLRPGNYTIESDRPVAFHGKTYQWTQTLDIVAGRDSVLELTAKNADSSAGVGAALEQTQSLETEPSLLLPRWQDSVVSLWTPTMRASGFLVDAKGLVVTHQRAIGTATSAEVQLSPSVKVAARVLASDSKRDVAVLWIDPSVVASVKPVPLGCAQPKSTLGDQQEIFAIGVRREKEMTSGTVAELLLIRGEEGGPVFTADGTLVGLTSFGDKNDDAKRGTSRVVPVADACEAIGAAEKKMAGAAAPPPTHLPIEPDWPVPADAFKEAAARRVGSLNPYQMSSSTFDVAFITPIMTYGAQYQSEQMSKRTRKSKDSRTIEIEPVLVRPTMDFGNWSEYVEDFPPVLLVRITPKQVEGLWKKVARGAALTQGVALPPLTRAKAGFARMRAYCGDREITPIHPFTVEHRLSDTDAAYEGLYVFAPDAVSPSCASVKLVLYAEKDPERGETATVDPRIVQQIAQDFALYPSH
jgi:hypothetical protein